MGKGVTMSYISGVISSSVNPAADLYAAIAPALTSAGYVLVDTVVISTRTHRVWRSPAAGNAQNVDWYLDVAYTTAGTGSVWLSPFEDFNPTSDLGFRGPYLMATSTMETTYYSRYGATGHALETNWTTVSTATNSLDASSANLSYWISVTANRVIGITSLNAQKIVYCGYFKPNAEHTAHAGAALFPLIVGNLLDSSAISAGNSSVVATRVPRTTVIGGWIYATRLWSYGSNAAIPEGGSGVVGDVSNNPFIGAVTPRGRKVYVLFVSNTTSAGFAATNSSSSAIVGELYDIYVFGATATVARGDTATISGETWVFASAVAQYYVYSFKAV